LSALDDDSEVDVSEGEASDSYPIKEENIMQEGVAQEQLCYRSLDFGYPNALS